MAGCDRVLQLNELADAALPDATVDTPPNLSGCADGSREGFTDIGTYPAIAGCAGAWSLPGLRAVASACGYQAGNDGILYGGIGCSSADLCAPTWHVCQTSIDTGQNLPVGDRSCNGLAASANMFFATAQGGAGGDCPQTTTSDDFQGCGTYGLVAKANCSPLDRTTNNACAALGGVGGWNCPATENANEVNTVTKTDPAMGGGVLCCRDL